MYFIESIKGDGVLELAISEQGKKKGQSMASLTHKRAKLYWILLLTADGVSSWAYM